MIQRSPCFDVRLGHVLVAVEAAPIKWHLPVPRYLEWHRKEVFREGGHPHD